MSKQVVRWSSARCVVALAMAAASAAGGCVVEDVSSIDLAVPAKTFSIDASRWRLDAEQTADYLATSCTNAPACNAAAELTCKAGCSGTCDGASARCQLVLDIRLYNSVDLVTERPELRTLPDQSTLHVGIDSVTYDIVDSTLAVATPVLTVFVAPASVTDPLDPEATPIGTVASVGPGATVTGGTVALSAAGRAALADAMSTYKTPFNVLVAATVSVTAGDPLPVGKLDAVVHIRAHAGL